MLKGKLRKIIIGVGLMSMTFVGTALIYYKNYFNSHGILVFKANDSNTLSILFWMIFLMIGVMAYLIFENRSLIKQNQQLLYKLLEQNEDHYNKLQHTNMNNREILLNVREDVM